jgi:hypothetical protein
MDFIEEDWGRKERRGKERRRKEVKERREGCDDWKSIIEFGRFR